MGLLFIAALIFAWPTFGLSILAWLALALYRANARVNKSTERDSRKIFLEPIFGDRFDEFFLALDMPLLPYAEFGRLHAKQCGRHIMNYIAHNPSEGALFMQGLEKWRTKGGGHDPVLAARDERQFNARGEVHLVAYRAVEALMTNNGRMKCFDSIDYVKVCASRLRLELLTA